MTLEAIPYIVVLGTLFGSTLLASRFSVGQFESMTYVGLRLVSAGVIHALIYLVTGPKRPWPRGNGIWWKAAILAITGTAVPMNLITLSLLYQSSGVTSILITLSPAITVVLAHIFLEDERLTLYKGLGVLLALSGAVLMLVLGETGLPDASEANPVGYLVVFISMLSSSLTTIFVRKNMQDFDPLDVASIRMWVAGLVVMPLSLLLVGFDLSRVNQQGWMVFGWATLIGTVLAQMLSFYIIQRFGATSSAMTSYIMPVVVSIGGALLLGEEITWGMGGAMVLIFIGILLINRRRKRAKEIVV